MTLTALVLAVAGTTVLVGAAGFMVHGKRALDVAAAAFRVRADIPGPWGPVSLGLCVFGVVIGIPLSLGLIETSVFSLLAAPLCCMVGTWMISGDVKQAFAQVAWFTVMAWCGSIPFLLVGSFTSNDPAAAQAVLGPLPFHQEPVSLGALAIGLTAGTLAASRWLSILPTVVSTEVGSMVRCGQAALAGTLLFGTAFGSGLAGIAYGVLDGPSVAWSVTSLAASAFGVVMVTWLSKHMPKVSDRYLFPPLAVLAASATVAAVLS